MNRANVPFDDDSSRKLDAAAQHSRSAAKGYPQAASETNDWEPVPLPGTMGAAQASGETGSRGTTDSVTGKNPSFKQQALIQDLRRCNEVLLARVGRLEEDLETSQRALQQEVERIHQSPIDQVAKAQQHSVAQLLQELEQSHAALKRQTLLSETLEAQLQTAQEQSRQLEQEYAVLQKRYGETAQNVLALEENCRDLRSRLQRQQRYTLQFKSALEKCLDGPSLQTPVQFQERSVEAAAPVGQADPVHPLAMPRADSIQPWSTTEAATQVDPHLLSLLRPLSASPAEPSDPAVPIKGPEAIAAQEADQTLWQDMERVIDSVPASPPQPDPPQGNARESTPSAAQFTEPLPWGAPLQPKAPSEAAQAEPESSPQPQAPSAVPSTNTTISKEAIAELLSGASGDSSLPNSAGTPAETIEIPAMEAARAGQTSPSPVVHPLRPTQRKRKSLAAVELPSFPPLPKSNQPG